MPTGDATSGDEATTTPVRSGRRVVDWLPNALSIARIAAGPVVIVALHIGSLEAMIVALAVMVIAEFTDLADGIVARRFESVSALGKIIDPMADSLYRALVFLGFMSVGWMPVWMVALIFSRDIVVSYIRIFTQQMGVTYAARTSGKIKAIVQAVAQFGCVIGIGLGIPGLDAGLGVTIAEGLLIAATLVTAWSGIDYALGAWRLWRDRA